MAISLDEVRRIAKLAHLNFAEDEYERFARQLSAILEYVEQLDRLDTGDIEPTAHIAGTAHALRDDAVSGSIPQEEALRNAPESGGGLFKVPRVIG